MTEETVVSDNLIGSEGGEADTSWQSRYLSDDLRGNDTLGKFEDVGALGKSYLELQKMVGSRIKVPTEESSDEEINDFYTKVGRPDAPEKYSVDLPEDSGYDQELIGQFYDVAYKNGLSNKQAQAAIEFYNHINTDMSINQDAMMQQSRGVLLYTSEAAYELLCVNPGGLLYHYKKTCYPSCLILYTDKNEPQQDIVISSRV